MGKPDHIPPAKQPFAAPLCAEPRPARRILLVEADPAWSGLNATQLRQQGYTVQLASDAEAAWDEVRIHGCDLLITESDLPASSGVGLLRKVCSASPSLSVILALGTLSSWQPADYPLLLKATMLLKPYAPEDLLALVASILPPPAGGNDRCRPGESPMGKAAPQRIRVPLTKRNASPT